MFFFFKENLFIWYEIWRQIFINNVFVKYVTEAYVLNNILKIFSCL